METNKDTFETVPVAWEVYLWFNLYTMNSTKTRKRPVTDPVTKCSKKFPSPTESPESETQRFTKQKLIKTATYS